MAADERKGPAGFAARRRQAASDWRDLGGLLLRSDRRGLLLLGAVVVLQALAPAAAMVLTGRVVHAVGRIGRPGAAGAVDDATVLIVGLFAVLAAGLALSHWAAALGKRLDLLFVGAVNDRLAGALLARTDIAALEDPAVVEEVGRLEEVEKADGHGRTVHNLAVLCGVRLSGVAALVITATFAWWAPLVLLLGWRILDGTFQGWVAKGVELGAALGSEEMRRSRYLRSLAVEPEYAKEIRLHGMADWLLDRYGRTWLRAVGEIWRGRRQSGMRVLRGIGGVTVCLGAVLGWAVWSLHAGALSAAGVVVLVQAVLGSDGVGLVGDPQWATAKALLNARRVRELERLTADDDPAPAAVPAPRRTPEKDPDGDPPRGALALDAVRFRYPRAGRDVLAGLTLDVPPGQSLAVVGANGAGKSTLIKLLCGLYRPDGGTLALDGRRDPRDLQAGVAVLFQDFLRYKLPLRLNVALGDPAAADDDARLLAALAAAGLPADSPVLAGGLDVPLGTGDEGAADLSGGQWQKVALARCLLALEAGARVLILDEPTAALDVRSETELFTRFLELTRGVTTVLVSHRLASVRRADRIVVLDGGTLAEDGTHDELLALDGRYAAMYRAQAARFTEVA